MARLTRLLLAAALTGIFALTGLGIGAAPASATALPISQCTTTSGVILAVDFSHWGGPLLRSCGSVPTTGFTLLNQGGWVTTGTQHDGRAFICRIGYSGFQSGTQYPTSATEACVKTPPATAYWSYWHANPGQNTWSYSQLGAMSYQPLNGSVDLWIFGGTNVAGTTGTPQFTPDSVRAHNVSASGGGVVAPSAHSSSTPTTGKPATSVSPASSNPKSTGAGSDSGMNRGPAASSSSATPAAKTTARTAKPTTSRAPTPATASTGTSVPSTGTRIVNAEPVADVKHSSGSFVPELIAGVVVLALGGAAGVTGWRRRQAR